LCTSAEALLAEDIDAVVISTPNFTHADYVIAALDAGKAVFSEKPVATTAEDCRRTIEADLPASLYFCLLPFALVFT
jgi:myo-inositol 2-dehydrogenase/D-chiro-inositol 1-dehydrogenase